MKHACLPITVLFLSVGALECACAAELSLMPWFTEDYSSFKAKSWKDGVGVWTRDGDDASVFDAERNRIVVNAPGDDLVFTPNEPSNAACPAVVDVQMSFLSAMGVDTLINPDSDAQASLVMGRRDDDTFVFMGWTRDGWETLSASAVAVSTNVLYDVRVEMDYSQTPARVRYSVNGQALSSDGGAEWFISSSKDKTSLSSIGFGGRGEVGLFSGEHFPPSPFLIDYVGSEPGQPVRLEVATNAAPRGAVTWQWYLGGRNKSWSAAPFSTAERPVLADTRCENWIRVVASDADGVLGEREFFFSRLPVAFLTTEKHLEPSPAKEEHAGTLFLQGNSIYPDQYDGPITIKVRGNSTSGLPKKPWKIKLDKKTDLFGFGKNKHWVLLANYLDVSLLRNTVAYDLSGALGLVHMKTTWVDVFLNGVFQGNYQLCEHIRVGEDRVNVYDWEDAAGSVAEKFADAHGLNEAQLDALTTRLEQDLSWVTTDQVTVGDVTDQPSKLWKKFSNDITGGYLFELSHEDDELSRFRIELQGLNVPVMLSKPEYLKSNSDMMDYAQTCWRDFFSATTAADGRTANGTSWVDLANPESMAAYWLAIEIPGNSDAVYKSRYAWKEQGQPLVFGPVWDFDWGCGSPVVGGTSFSPSGWKVVTSDNNANFMREWGDDPYFCLLLWEKYRAVRGYLTELLREGGIFDRHLDYLAESGSVDSDMWYNPGNNRNGYTFDKDSAWFKRYLTERVAWIDGQFASVQSIMASVATTASRMPYTRCPPAKLAPVFTRGKPNPSSTETGVLDVRVPAGIPVEATMTTTSTTMRSLEVVVNGRVVATESVSGGACAFEIPVEALREEGCRNMVDLIGRTASGDVVYRTWALVTRWGGSRIFIR